MSGGKLPEGWVQSELDNILLTIIGGGTPSKAIPEYYQGDIPWMSVKDMNKHILTDTVDHITNDAVENSSTNIIPAGTPIIATRMSLGKIVIASFDSAINQDLKALFLSSGVDRNFFIHWYRSQAQLIESLGTGTTVKGIRLEVLKALSINLPPFFEQKIIAEKLNTLLAQVGSTKARLEQIPQILKRFRQAVLTIAINGKLTENFRVQNKLKDNWVEMPLERLACSDKYSLGIGPFGSNLKVEDYREKGHPLIFVRDIRACSFSNSETRYIDSSKFEELKAHRAKPGDLLITKMGDPPGDAAIYPSDCEEAVITADCIKLRVANELALSKFILFAIMSNEFRAKVVEISAGVAQQKVNLKNFKKLQLNIPPLPEQHEIVRRVEQLFAYADTIEKQVNSALTRVNSLTQSILAKAFRGELTAQWRAENPSLISGENSAAALLEKIKAERAASGGKKALRKKA